MTELYERLHGEVPYALKRILCREKHYANGCSFCQILNMQIYSKKKKTCRQADWMPSVLQH